MRHARSPAWWVVVLALGAVYGLHHVADPDVFQQVAVGRALVEHPASIGVSDFVAPFPAHPYVEDKWLPSVVAATFDRWLPRGDGLALYQLLIGVGLSAAWFFSFRSVSRGAASAAAATAVSFVAAAFRVGPRPDTWSLALLAIAIALFVRVRRPAALAAAFAALMLVWVNVHGYFVNGLLVAFAAAVAGGMGDPGVPAIAGARGIPERLARGAAILAFGAIACVVHPQGPRALAGPLAQLRELLGRAPLRESILEFQPTSVLFAGGGAFHAVAALAAFVAAIALGARDGAAARVRGPAAAVAAVPWLIAPPDGLRQWPYRVTVALLVASSFAVLPAIRRRQWFPVFLLAGFVVLAVPVVRNTALVPAVAALLLVAQFDPKSPIAVGDVDRRRGWALAAALAIAISGLARIGDWIPPGHHRAPEWTGWGIDPTLVPEGAVSHALREGLPGPWLNTFDHGGYLLYRAYPERRPFIAGNTAMYPADFLEHYRRDLIHARDPMIEIRRRGFRTAIVGLTAPEATPIVRALAGDPEWRLDYADPGGAVFVRGPGTSEPVPASTARLVELARATRGRAIPGSRRHDWPAMNVVVFLGDLGRPQEAWTAWEALAVEPLADEVLALGAEIASGAGHLPRLVEALDRAFARRPHDAEIRDWSARARYVRAIEFLEGGELVAAADDLDAAIERAPGSGGPHLARAIVLSRLGDVRAAREALARAIALDTDGSIRGAIRDDPDLAALSRPDGP